jgi:hypothetical protein
MNVIVKIKASHLSVIDMKLDIVLRENILRGKRKSSESGHTPQKKGKEGQGTLWKNKEKQ